MKITVEISMYPLREDYEQQVLNFISKIDKIEGLTFSVNALNTQIQGDQKIVMNAINKAISEIYSSGIRASFVMKILPGDIALDYAYNHTWK